MTDSTLPASSSAPVRPPLLLTPTLLQAAFDDRPLFVVAFPAVELCTRDPLTEAMVPLTAPATQSHYLTEFAAHKAARRWNEGSEHLPPMPAPAVVWFVPAAEVRAAFDAAMATTRRAPHAD